MEKGGGKLIARRTIDQRRKASTDINGWLPAVDVANRGSKYSARAKVHHRVQQHGDGSERSVHKDQQQLTVPAEKNHLRHHSGSSSKHFPNYNFRNSHLISATPSSKLPSPNVSMTTRPQTRPRSCIHCVHLFNAAPKFSTIHSTLAYAKCRCHRPDTSNRLKNQTSLSADHCDNTNGRVFKRVEFPCMDKDSSQVMLPSLKRNPDHLSEQPPMESSLSGLPSTSKLPTLKSGSVISTGSNSQQQLLSTSQHRLLRKSSQLLHNSTAKLTPITETSDTTPTTKKKHETNFKLTDLWKYVNDEKREQLIKLFKKLDTDDDGHITWKEFSSYFNEMDHALKHYLHELYKLTSAATYFGKQEFIVCYNVHELLHCKNLPSSLYLNVDRYYLNNFILPFLIKMSVLAKHGQLNIQHLERSTLHTSSSSQLIFARAKQWTESSEVSLLQLLSYAPVILTPI